MSEDQFNLTGTSEVKISSALFTTVMLRSIYGLGEVSTFLYIHL